MRKQKVLMLADDPLRTSGVGCQGRHLIEGLTKTGRWSFRVLGGAIKHESYDTVTVNDDFIVKPVDGFGTPDMLRSVLAAERPDVLLLFTDPRFFIWVWEMEEEVHQFCPIAYWHVWDNDPFPEFNDVLYRSTDLINCHSHLTYSLLKDRYQSKVNFIPHAVPENMFFPMEQTVMMSHRDRIIGADRRDHFVCIWVNRNARRKMPGNVMMAWKLFLDKLEERHGHKNATLLMHTHPYDPEGQNLPVIAEHLRISDNVVYSTSRLNFDEMCVLYNISDCAVNISCFPAGELVQTRSGMEEIQNIAVGTEVLTHMGRYRPVTNVWTNPRVDRDVYIVKSTNNLPVRVTGNHEVKAIRRADLPKGFFFNDNVSNVLDYVSDHRIETLSVGDYVVQFCDHDEYKPVGNYHVIDLWNLICCDELLINSQTVDSSSRRFLLKDDVISFNRKASRHYHNEDCTNVRNLVIDEDMAYVIGRWNADGSSGTTSIIFNGKEIDARDKIAEIYDRKFGGHSLLHRNDHAGCTDLAMRGAANAVMTRFFAEYCGHGSEFKRIPEFIFTSPEAVRRAYLAGHFGGDGCDLTHPQYGTKKKRIRTISNALARGLKRLLVGLGYVPFVKRGVNGGWGKKLIWTIEWHEGCQHNGSSRMWNIDGKALVSRIYSLEVDEKCTDENVYTLEVEEDHWYACHAFSARNCHEGFGMGTLEAMQCGRPIIALKTGGLTRQVVDHRDGSIHGVALDPDVRDFVGGQTVPYIYEDHVSIDKVAQAYMTLYEMGADGRTRLGKKAHDYVTSEFNLQDTVNMWDSSLTAVTSRWRDDRQSIYRSWEVTEL
jgi:hypothetical protein